MSGGGEQWWAIKIEAYGGEPSLAWWGPWSTEADARADVIVDDDTVVLSSAALTPKEPG